MKTEAWYEGYKRQSQTDDRGKTMAKKIGPYSHHALRVFKEDVMKNVEKFKDILGKLDTEDVGTLRTELREANKVLQEQLENTEQMAFDAEMKDPQDEKLADLGGQQESVLELMADKVKGAIGYLQADQPEKDKVKVLLEEVVKKADSYVDIVPIHLEEE